MALYRAYGNQLVDNNTTMEMVASGRMRGFEAEFAPEPARGLEGVLTPFKEIGIGKPLTIEIRHIYDGMLVTSAIRSLATFNAAPRAVNFLKDKVQKHTNMETPHATEEGTPLVFYSPALAEKNTILTIEFIFDEFPRKAVESIAKAFSTAAAIPLFAAQSTYLVAAGMLTNLVGVLGERLLDGRPPFTVTEPLHFLRGGDEVPQQGFHLMAKDDFDLEVEGCQFDDEKGELVYKSNGKAYDGRHPYVVFSLDGAENEDYEKFTATAASATLLESFYHIGEGQSQPLDDLMSAVTLFNDWRFRQKADGLESKLAAAEVGTEEYERLKAQYDAYVANILNTALKPS
jgi:hypothetical protein